LYELFVDRGLVGGLSNGEYSNGVVAVEKVGEPGGSQKPLVKDEFLEISSDGGVGQGKHEAQDTGLSWVQRIEVGP
jgi:hypothetical protein